MIDVVKRTFYRFAGGNTTPPVTLGLRNIYILPTGYGVLYLAVIGAMMIGSVNYNNNLGFLLTFLMGSLGLTAMLHTYATLYGLRLVAATAEPVFAGEPLEVEIALADIDRPRLGIRWYVDPAAVSDVDLEPGGPHRVVVRAPPRQRGRCQIGWLHVTSDYPVGLFRAWSRIDPHLTALIYPRPLPGPEPVAENGRPSFKGAGSSTIRAGTDDFQGLSAYRAGDPPGRIHWQAYSRGRGLHTKIFAGQAGRHVMLDIDRIGDVDTERKLSLLSYCVVRACHQGRSVGLQLGTRLLPADRGRHHRDRCLRALALYGRD